jgi:aminoglycoside phosphotransferase (APT) family kinase protein
VRRPTRDTLEERQAVTRAEYDVLARCSALGIAVPAPCFLDTLAQAVVLEYVEGAPDFAPANIAHMLEQMATQLAGIHALCPHDLGSLRRRWDNAERNVLRAPAELDLTLDEPGLRAVLLELWPWQAQNPDALLHGDYWPGNLLWKDGELSAVLDWEETELGDPLADISVARLDLLWAFGEGAMDAFTRCYRDQTQIDWQNLARWDLCVALRPMSDLARWARGYAEPPICRPDVTELSMRDGHRRFVQQALRSLGIAA